MKTIITTFSFIFFLAFACFAQEDIILTDSVVTNKLKNEFTSGLLLGAGYADILKSNTERDLSIKEPFENSGLIALSFSYNFNLTNNIALTPRVDIMGSFKRFVQQFEHSRNDAIIDVESRIIAAQANLYPVIKLGLKKVKLYGSFGWYFGKVFDYSVVISETSDEDTLGEFYNDSEKGVSIIGGIEILKMSIEGFFDYSNVEIVPGHQQKFVGLRMLLTM